MTKCVFWVTKFSRVNWNFTRGAAILNFKMAAMGGQYCVNILASKRHRRSILMSKCMVSGSRNLFKLIKNSLDERPSWRSRHVQSILGQYLPASELISLRPMALGPVPLSRAEPIPGRPCPSQRGGNSPEAPRRRPFAPPRGWPPTLRRGEKGF